MSPQRLAGSSGVGEGGSLFSHRGPAVHGGLGQARVVEHGREGRQAEDRVVGGRGRGRERGLLLHVVCRGSDQVAGVAKG